MKGNGIPEVWKLVERFRAEMTASGEWAVRRLSQVREGLVEFAREQVLAGMAGSEAVQLDLERFGADVAEGKMTLREAATRIAGDFLRERGRG